MDFTYGQEGAQNPDRGASTYYLANFFYQKLHENERNWTERGHRSPESANALKGELLLGKRNLNRVFRSFHKCDRSDISANVGICLCVNIMLS